MHTTRQYVVDQSFRSGPIEYVAIQKWRDQWQHNAMKRASFNTSSMRINLHLLIVRAEKVIRHQSPAVAKRPEKYVVGSR